jgi:hypothetical protein
LYVFGHALLSLVASNAARRYLRGTEFTPFGRPGTEQVRFYAGAACRHFRRTEFIPFGRLDEPSKFGSTEVVRDAWRAERNTFRSVAPEPNKFGSTEVVSDAMEGTTGRFVIALLHGFLADVLQQKSSAALKLPRGGRR